MAINFVQQNKWQNRPQHLHVTLLYQTIDSIPSVEHYASPVINPETGETITSYENWPTTP